MTFDDFYRMLQELAKKHGKDTHLRIDRDGESELVRICGKDTTPLSRAKNGLEDVLELSYTAAEHHPFWNLLYRSSEISRTVLEKWDADMSREDLDELSWSIDELKSACSRLQERLQNDSRQR